MKRRVSGEGPLRPRFILVGEAPGKEEEKVGRPFVGRAGRLLRAALSASGIAAEDCYITNVVKTRPSTAAGANRKPDRNEVARSLSDLKRELSRRPCAPVILLGDTAASALLGGKFKIGRHHGLAVAAAGRGWYISYHPSAAVRFQKIRRLFNVDLAALPRKFEPREMFTIGHSTRTLPGLVRVLKRYGIERLVDIRHYPRSRHNPQFNKNGLGRELRRRGIAYEWLGSLLGGFRPGGYESYMLTPDFAAGLNRLLDLSFGRRTAIMCAELIWFRCHRRHVADALADLGQRVTHLLDEDRSELHRHVSGARIKCEPGLPADGKNRPGRRREITNGASDR